MSFRVLVIPEDPTHNGYLLKPVVEAVLADAGRPRARVTVLNNPRLEGYDHALRAIRDELPDRYGFWDLWVFIPDADRASVEAMANLEKELGEKGISLICSPAQPEVEIYACAAFRKEISLSWDDVRSHAAMKEEIFESLLEHHGDSRRAGAGRDLMVAASLANLPLLYQLCPELNVLRDRITNLLKS